MIRARVWNEGWHEQHEPEVLERYPDGIHGEVANALRELLADEVSVATTTMDAPHQGLAKADLDETDVLLIWAHMRHDEVEHSTVQRVVDRVHEGMGLVVLHSAHHSRIFRALMGTTCHLSWRHEGGRELVWTSQPNHPIADGVSHPIVIDGQEMYGEPFDIPNPDDIVFMSSFTGGEMFRSGVTFRRGAGRIFYFSPGDQSYPVYRHPDVRRVLANAVRWCMPSPGVTPPVVINAPAAH